MACPKCGHPESNHYWKLWDLGSEDGLSRVYQCNREKKVRAHGGTLYGVCACKERFERG